MRIVSLNAWGGAMFDELRAWLPTLDVDVVCLQEVTRTPGISGWTRFADGERALPQRANLFNDVADLLPEFRGSFAPSDSGPVTGAEGRRLQQEFGIATFVRERVEVIESDSSFVHGSFTEHTDWAERDRPRVALAVRLTQPDGAVVTVTQLHGLRDPSGKQDTPERLAQAKRLAEFVTNVRRPGDLAVVCGDLNVLPESKTFDILARIGLTDLVGDADTRTSQYPKSVRHADYMLVSAPEEVRSLEIVAEPEVSDHRALLLAI